MKVVFPGSFCPPTLGHLDIIERLSKMFDSVVVAVGVNSEKTYDISVENRVDLLKKMTKHLSNVEVLHYNGFTTDFCKSQGADILAKAARNAVDFQQIVDVGRLTASLFDCETVVLIADKRFENISSSLVREFVKNDKDIAGLVDTKIHDEIVRLLIRRNNV